MEHEDWWRGAVIYQIYPRSFMDSNGDGIGDLRGIADRLDYAADLGMDAVWISPFFRSPMHDFGYDIADYCGVDPIFGTLEDFDHLIARAHDLGLRVLVDQVLCHTSDDHPWFKDSRRGRDGDKASWYVWRDARPDGSPPNNWLSLFGGSAWSWVGERRQYYLHKFLPQQPNLNLDNPEVCNALLETSRFWLDRGVDGFRLDSVNFFHHDPDLRDNPPRPEEELRKLLERLKGDDGIPRVNPYNMQMHVHDKTQPQTVSFLQGYRRMLDVYSEVTTIAEIAADASLKLVEDYTAGRDRLHMGYTFELLSASFDRTALRDIFERMEAEVVEGWPCWAFSNHDIVRAATRWGPRQHSPAFSKMLLALLTSLRGSACIYQGEELGLSEARIDFDDLQDPYGRRFWPEYQGRDGCRTPMPWTADAPHAGFSVRRPWLPVPPEHHELAVDVQTADLDSVLNGVRAFLRWRRRQSALRGGSIRFLPADDGLLAFERAEAAQRIVAIFNLQNETITIPCRLRPFEGHGFAADFNPPSLTLPPFGVFFGEPS